MALSNTVQWRVRTGGNDANGGGFDASVSGTLATTLNGAISSSATTVVVASATGWPASGNYYARIGATGPELFSTGGTGSSEIVQVTGGQGTTSWTVTRGQLGTTAQAFATGIAVDNNLSRCNTAPLSGTAGTSTNSTTFSDAGVTFDLTCVGNIIQIASGAGFTTGFYIIQSRTNATTVVLDRACGTGTAAVWKMGGAWLSAYTNVNGAAHILPGHSIYLRAGGSGSVASPDYINASFLQIASGDGTNGFVKLVGENGKPFMRAADQAAVVFGPGTTGQMIWRENLYLIAVNATNGNQAIDVCTGVAVNVTVDQNGFDVNGFGAASVLVNCEAFSSTANAGAAGSFYGINDASVSGNYSMRIYNCNVHDCWGSGIYASKITSIENTIIAKNRGNAIVSAASDGISYYRSLINCTIDANDGHGITFTAAADLAMWFIAGSIFSNHTGSGKYAVHCNFGSAAANDRVRGFVDNNAFYNNTNNALNMTFVNGYQDGHLYANSIGVDPGFTGQSTQNYTTGSALQNLGFPQIPFSQSKSGQTTGVRNYQDPGATQPINSAAVTVVINSRATAHARR